MIKFKFTLSIVNVVDDNNLTPLEDIGQTNNVINESDSYLIDESWIAQKEYDEIMDHKLCIEKENKAESVLQGRRIVNIAHIVDNCLYLGRNHASICTSGSLVITNEIKNGFYTKICLKCTMCNREYSLTSEPNITADKTPEVNKLGVWGTIATGSTFSHLEEFCAIMDIPCMSSGKFYSVQDDLSDLWQDQAIKDMADAAKKEAAIAIAKGDVDENGIPFITVNVDGGWSKRTYGHSYNAASGVAVIIGKETKKVLHMGVRNKFCILCKRTPDKQHRCFKNWNGSSSAMESDIIINGFNSSETNLHNFYP